MLIYASTRGWIEPADDMQRDRLFRCSDMLELITTNHYRHSSACFTTLEEMGVFLGNGCFQVAVAWILGEQVFCVPGSDILRDILDSANQLLQAPFWYAYTCGGRLYFLLCYPRLQIHTPEAEAIAAKNISALEQLQSCYWTEEKKLRILASDLCNGESEIYLMTNSLMHAAEYAEFRNDNYQTVHIHMEEQLHKAFVDDLSTYRILAIQLTDAIRLPNCDVEALAQDIAGRIISSSSASMESLHHHLQIFALSFIDYLGGSGTVNTSFLQHHKVTTRIMRFEQEEELVARLKEILSDIHRQFQHLETMGRQKQILHVREYVDNHITDAGLSVGSVSEQFHITPSRLTSLFQHYFGVTLYKYIQRERLNYCCTIMEQRPDLTVEELAEISGYIDLSTMYRAFKKYKGTTPGTLRFSHLREEEIEE
jgi:AraC-like DNA-binding protein